MSKPLTFVLNDESINAYGTRVLTSGIDLSLFKKNPIALWVHSRDYYKGQQSILPIGKWVNPRVEGVKLLADVEFDEDDEFAMKIKGKVEKGIINMASIGIDILTISEDVKFLNKGQTRPTIVKCLLKEASLCDIGANRNAIRLYDADLLMSNDNANINQFLPLIKNRMELKESLKTTLKLSDSATDSEVIERVSSMQSKLSDLEKAETLRIETKGKLQTALKLSDGATESEILACVSTMQSKIEGHEAAETLRLKDRNETLVSDAIKERKITESQKETYLTLADKDFDNTKQVLDALPAAIDLGDKGGDKSDNDTKGKNHWKTRIDEINENNKKK